MTDYAKKTVADLTEILKSRGLPHTGKKADLVARLTEADKAAETTSASAPPAASPPAQQPAAEVPPPSATSTAVPTAPAPPAPATTTHQTDLTEESSAAAAGATTAPTDAPTPDTALAAATYKLDLPTSSVDDELKKRQARAARFGTTATATATDGDNDKDTEAQRALERAKRFGTGETAMGKLDEALPMTTEKKGERKRGADDSGLKGRGGGGGKRSRGGGQGGGRGERPHAAGRQNSAAPRGEKPVGVVKVQPAFVSEKDRAAAEARKKKFGA